jgi:hypothetical protein
VFGACAREADGNVGGVRGGGVAGWRVAGCGVAGWRGGGWRGGGWRVARTLAATIAMEALV